MINKKYFSSAATFSRNSSLWTGMESAPIDFNFHLKEEMKSDPNPMKVNLGVGAYRDDDGHPFVLNSVRKAKRMILDQNFGHEESTPDGSVNFRNKALSLAFGPLSEIVTSERAATCQAISGMGSVRLGYEYLKRFYPNKKSKILIPNINWPFHKTIGEVTGFEVETYRYYNSETKSFDL